MEKDGSNGEVSAAGSGPPGMSPAPLLLSLGWRRGPPRRRTAAPLRRRAAAPPL